MKAYFNTTKSKLESLIAVEDAIMGITPNVNISTTEQDNVSVVESNVEEIMKFITLATNFKRFTLMKVVD